MRGVFLRLDLLGRNIRFLMGCAEMRRKIHITGDGVREVAEEPAVDNGSTPEAAAEANSVQAEVVDESASGLATRIAELEAALATEKDHSLRTLAEFQNFRRRMEEENRRHAQFANEELVRALLPVLDNFERALAAAEKNHSFESLMGGVTLTHRQLLDLLKKTGVEPIETKGRTFDPNYHEAVERVPESGEPENQIVQELQRGYMMNSRVLRPSLVRVAGG